DYYIGLDVGTGSVGWAVTDTEYSLLRKHGKDYWGVYLFDEAQTAADRGRFRKNRRSMARRRHRLMLLQSLFKDEIEKVDPLFFLRLNNSAYAREDKDFRLAGRDSLFGGNGYRDKDYFKKYPTIYHLRSALAHGEEIGDVRLLYLAVHHILKHRGHFLFGSQSFDIGDHMVVCKSFSDMNAWIQDNWAETGMETLETEDLESVIQELSVAKHGKRDKYQALLKLYGLKNSGKDPVNNSRLNILKAITGAKFNLKGLFMTKEAFAGDNDSVSFDSVDFDDAVMPEIEDGYGEDRADFVRILKSIHDWFVLAEIMKDFDYFSDSKVDAYVKHSYDLTFLKAYVKTECPEKYGWVFRRQNSGKKAGRVSNYASYIGMDNKKGFARCTKEEFYSFLKNDLKIDDDTILAEMDNGTFLPLQTCKDNACVPYQVILKELEAILDNAAKQFPFLNEKEGELTVRDRIVMLMTFNVPYYVGPLKGGFSWAKFVEGKEGELVTPWNFDEVIDHDATEDAFINRMTCKCTYLPDQDVLPSASFLYSEYKFLNELNCLRFNGVKDERVKQFIYEYAKNHRKVTLDACIGAMVSGGILPEGSKKEQFTGIDGDFHNSLASYNDFAFLGAKRDAHPEMCEDIIRWITVISDRTRLVCRIRKNYGKILSKTEISRLASLKYRGWGRLSKELLEGIRSPECANCNGEPVSIIEKMREGSENFMELYHRYGFNEVVKERNQGLYSDKVTYSYIKSMQCSATVKRPVWKAVELVREIVKVCGGQPKKIFVEMSREVKGCSGTGQMTKSRKEKLLELYSQPEVLNNPMLREDGDWLKRIKSTPDYMFNNIHLYLYYLQFGRSIYSCKKIELEDVIKGVNCDKDHIYPQSKIKDDSVDNLILVLKTENQGKRDVYPVSEDIRTKMHSYWALLLHLGMMSPVKYYRLNRSTPLTEDDITDFVNRQLTFTLQSTKIVAETMQKLLPGSEVVYAKSGNADDFKKKFKIIKVRELNDLHHAKDAYINIIVGNVFNTKFNHDASVYFKEHGISGFDLTTLYDDDIKGAWSPSYIERIISTVEKDACTVVHMVTSGYGEMFDQQIVPAGTHDNLIPIKDRAPFYNTSRYGGYNSVHFSSYMLVRSLDKNGKPMLTMEWYPLHYEKRYGNSTEEKIRYCEQILGFKDPVIVLNNIKAGTLISKRGSYATIRGKAGDDIIICNANQLHLDRNSMITLNEVCRYMDSRFMYRKKDLPMKESISSGDLLSLYDVFTEKLAIPAYKNLRYNGNYAGLLMNGRTAFLTLTKEQQAAVLYEILHLLQCKPRSLADLSAIGGSKYAGALKQSMNLTGQDVKFIFQSPTGYYTRIISVKDML
ncbi:MAG: type II CRISPR RNA-guided endonuclease Cas9, partial [Clostridia bacterium]|nr:type II CRISPR RNA-guided endonuclease Cas9 [Clostridia bacterium]